MANRYGTDTVAKNLLRPAFGQYPRRESDPYGHARQIPSIWKKALDKCMKSANLSADETPKKRANKG